MTRIVLDAEMRTKLNNFREPLELCDESGNIMARLTPCWDPTRFNLEPQISREEMERRKQSTEPTFTTAEVLALLEKL